MPRKMRKGRVKQKLPRRPESSPPGEVRQSSAVSFRQTPKSQIVPGIQENRHRQVAAELKRAAVIGAILFALLVVLSLLFR